MKKILHLFKTNPLYAQVAFALFISGIGTAFTSVAVYHELAKRSTDAFGFAAAFAAGILPGLFTSMMAGRWANRWNWGGALIAGQLFGLISLMGPLIGSYNGNIALLLAAEAAASAVGGFLVPIFKGFERSSYGEEHFQALAMFDTFILAGNFIFGQGLGSLLASRMTLKEFIILDAATYAVALLAIFPLRKKIKGKDFSVPNLKVRLLPEQKKALLILPWLALVCAPPMVLMPARAYQWGASYPLLGFIAVAPVLLLLCARTLGQILGPIFAAYFDMSRVYSKNWTLPAFLLAYLGLYCFAFNVSSAAMAASFVFTAHIFSNVVYAIGNYQMLKVFNSEEIVWASGWVYRRATFVIGLSALVAGGIANEFGLSSVFLISAASLFLGVWAGGKYEMDKSPVS